MSLKKLLADRRIEEISIEPGQDHRHLYFVYLKKGWVFDQTGEAHCFSEDTLRDVRTSMRRVVRCECDDCKK